MSKNMDTMATVTARRPIIVAKGGTKRYTVIRLGKTDWAALMDVLAETAAVHGHDGAPYAEAIGVDITARAVWMEAVGRNWYVSYQYGTPIRVRLAGTRITFVQA